MEIKEGRKSEKRKKRRGEKRKIWLNTSYKKSSGFSKDAIKYLLTNMTLKGLSLYWLRGSEGPCGVYGAVWSTVGPYGIWGNDGGIGEAILDLER